jgi:hypothetical protein
MLRDCAKVFKREVDACQAANMPRCCCCCRAPVCKEADLALAVAAIVVAAQLRAVAARVQPVLKQAAGNSNSDRHSSSRTCQTYASCALC